MNNTSASPPRGTGRIRWQQLRETPDFYRQLWRTPVPGGWLVCADKSMVFVPDRHHRWRGSSIKLKKKDR